MKQVFILNTVFFTSDGKKISIGGVETYIKMLIDVIKKMNMTPVVLQFADIDFLNRYEDVIVYGVAVKQSWSLRKKNKQLFSKCKKLYNASTDIIIFATDFLGVKNSEPRVIGIQHGITWDVEVDKKISSVRNLLYVFLKALYAIQTVIRVRRFNLLVGVDYNFLNWYRTQLGYIETKVKVIPNCTYIENFEKRKSKNINIIFARRFYKYRGTRLFSSVIQRILIKHDNINVTFAGNGPDEKYLKKLFVNNKNVNFIEYDSKNSFEIHKSYQIAVIPTIGSEGTSLSLLEAMAAKCAVIGTNVGGITNIILDHYNGLMINPNEDELYKALDKLIIDREFRENISENAYRTVSNAFNKHIWEKRWTSVIDEISHL